MKFKNKRKDKSKHKPTQAIYRENLIIKFFQFLMRSASIIIIAVLFVKFYSLVPMVEYYLMRKIWKIVMVNLKKLLC
jgi:hypothetical protein